MRRPIGWVRGIFISSASIILLLVLLEGGARLFLRLRGERILTIPREFYWENRPGMRKVEDGILYEINSHGHRGREYRIEKEPGVTRVVCVGDSCTFGFLNREEDTYPRLLEKCLNDAAGRKFEVINAGVSGYSTLQEALALALKVLPLRPDWVIIQCGHNNRSKNFPTDRSALYARKGVLSRLAGKSAFLLLARRLSRRWGFGRPSTDFDLEKSLANVRGDLEVMIDRCRKAGARVIVLTWGQNPDVERFTEEGIRLYREGRYGEAVAALSRAADVRYNWDWRPAHYLKLCYEMTGQEELAARAARRERELKKEHPWVLDQDPYLDIFAETAGRMRVPLLEYRDDTLRSSWFEDICHPSPEFTRRIARDLCRIIAGGGTGGP